jgi:hypothetical protein
MKKSELKQIIREEVRKLIKEYGSESIYYSNPGGTEQIKRAPIPRLQQYTNKEKWKVTAMQLGAVVIDRGDDWIAIMPNQDVLGTFGKMTNIGELHLFT